MMLKTYLGPIEDESGLHYLRPETAQGIFVNFANVVQVTRARSRRSASARSASPSATRSRRATSSSAPASSSRWRWSSSSCRAPTRSGTSTGSTSAPAGTPTSASRRDNLRHFEHPKEKLSHYSKRTVDIEYRFGFAGSEWGELEGIANRTDFDLSTHTEHSGTDLSYFDQANGERYVPYVIEPAAGLTRSLMAFLVEAYAEDEAPNTKGGVDKRTVLKLDPRLAPVKAAVLPLSRNEALSPKARDLAAELREATGTSTSTTPRRSAAATAGRTRSARRSASPSTSTPWRTARSPSASATRWPRSGSPGQGHRLPGGASAGLLMPTTDRRRLGGGARPLTIGPITTADPGGARADGRDHQRRVPAALPRAGRTGARDSTSAR